jgi:hypothetical protein
MLIEGRSSARNRGSFVADVTPLGLGYSFCKVRFHQITLRRGLASMVLREFGWVNSSIIGIVVDSIFYLSQKAEVL